MLEIMRNALKGWVGKVVIAFFTLPFLLLGFTEVLSSLSASNAELTVNGEEVPAQEIARAVEINKQQMKQRFGESFDISMLPADMLRSNAIDQLVQRKVVEQYADTNNLRASFDQVSKIIREVPSFRDESGQFDQEMFETVLAQQGLNPKQAIALIGKDLVSSQPGTGISGSGFALTAELNDVEVINNQKRDIAYLALKLNNFKKEIKVSDEQINDYYKSNSSQFMTQEMVSVDYLELKSSELVAGLTASDDEIEARYQAFVDGFSEQEMRKAAHILINVNDEQSDSDAFKKISEISEKLKAGEDFASLAKENSDDPGSAKEGGNLGLAGKGSYVPEFEETLLSLKEGEVSEPVLTEFGYHIIRLDEVVLPEVPSLIEEKSRIEKDVINAKAADLFEAKLAEIDEVIYESPDLQSSAAILNKEVLVSSNFSANQGEGIATNKELRDIAFSDEILTGGENSNVIELGANHIAFIRLNTHSPASVKPIESVKSGIEQKLLSTLATEKVADLSASLLAKLNEGEAASAIAREAGAEWVSAEGVKRSQADIPREVLAEAFKIAKPVKANKTSSSVSAAGGDSYLITVTKVEDGIVEDATNFTKHAKRLAVSNGNQDFNAFIAQLKKEAKVEKNEAAPSTDL